LTVAEGYIGAFEGPLSGDQFERTTVANRHTVVVRGGVASGRSTSNIGHDEKSRCPEIK
jgi:hypothetical protein